MSLIFVFLLSNLRPGRVLAQTADKQASDTTKRVFSYMRGLSRSTSGRVLSGQSIGHGPDIATTYDRLVVELGKRSGHYPAIIGADYGYTSETSFSDWNPTLIAYWKAGGLVELSWHFDNPWTGGDCNDLGGADLIKLITRGESGYETWQRQLARAGDVLEALQKEGVTVLWRPFHELNGDWFWWGMRSHPGDPAPMRNLWRAMFTYFHVTRGLHNLIWVYSVTGYKQGETFARPLEFYYPGADVVDVVGIDVYDDEATMRAPTDYAALKAFKKPVAITEIGPNSINDGSWDQQKLLVSLREKYPEVVYWLSWHDWRRNGAWIYKSMVHNKNAEKLLNDPLVINREEL